MRLVDDLGREHHHLAIVLVSNNPYVLDHPLARGTRPALDTGHLGIAVLDMPGETRRSLARTWTAPRLEMTAAKSVHAGVDGEAIDLARYCGLSAAQGRCAYGSPHANRGCQHRRAVPLHLA